MATTFESTIGQFALPDGEPGRIRMMNLSDLPKVHDLELKVYKDPWSVSHFRHEIMNSQVSWTLVAESATQLLGYAVVWFVEDELHIANIAAASAFRRKGIATNLLMVILEEGLKRQVNRAFLEVRISNYAAIRLYKKFGFELIGSRNNYYFDGEDAIVMQRHLPRRHDSSIAVSMGS